jgi:ATP-dependent exoDNAse (exonuclease V) beta subunit
MLSKDQMDDVIKYCRSLKREIESTYGGKNGGRFLYYPELKIKSPATDPQTQKPIELSGMIDLLVIPPEGDPFIIDYKVSPNDYENEAKRGDLPEDIEPDAYNRAKKLGFAYQLSTYGRMMGRIKPALRSPKVLVAPI